MTIEYITSLAQLTQSEMDAYAKWYARTHDQEWAYRWLMEMWVTMNKYQ